MRYAMITLLLIFLAVPAFAGEISILGGQGWTTNPTEKTFAWQVQYMEGLGEHFA